MIGLVIVTHGGLAREFLSAMEHVVGPQSDVIPICIGPDDDMEARRGEILDAVLQVDKDQGVILLTDMFGGTPSNLAISAMSSGHIEVIAGVNLPMLVRAFTYRAKGMETMITKAVSGGRDGVLHIELDPVYATTRS